MSDRLHELRAGLAHVEDRIVRACADSGREPDEVQLVVVTKTFPASDVRLLADSVLFLDKGRILLHEPTAQFLEHTDVSAVARFLGR